MDDPRILEADEAYALGLHDRTVIAVWRGPCTKHAVDAMYEACESLLSDESARSTFIAVLKPTAPAPPEAARAVLARWSRYQVPKLSRAVVVAEGGGFRAATIQGVSVALTLLLPHRALTKFVGSVGAGVEALAPFLGPRRPAELSAAIEQLRGAIGPRRLAGQKMRVGAAID